MSDIDYSTLQEREEKSEFESLTVGDRFELPTAIFTISLLVFVLISTLKSLRPPNLWAVTQLTFNYSHGFVRRGFLGELIRLAGLDSPYRYNILALIGMTAFVLCAVGTALLIRKALRAVDDQGRYQLAVLVAVASPAIMFIVHIAGYLDNFGMAAMLCFLLLYTRGRRRSPYIGFLIVAALSIPLALVHENLVVIFAPVMAFAVVCVGARRLDEQNAGLRSRIFWGASIAATAAVCIVSALLVARWGTRSHAEVDALRRSIAETSEFVPRKDTFIPLYRDVSQNFSSVMPGFYKKARYWRSFAIALFTVLPALAFLLYLGWTDISRIRISSAFRFPIRLLFLGACLSPLSLHLFGLDKPRWNALAVFCSFCAVSVVQTVFGDRMARAPVKISGRGAVFIGAAIAAIALGLAGGSQMFDHETVRMYPYESFIEFTIDWAQKGFSYIPKY